MARSLLTNLFPAMTLGCGAPGGNIPRITSGPQHLMNIKRIAWESRGIEHRTIPAEQRMAGAAPLAAPEAVQGKSNVASVGQALFFTPREGEGLPVPPVEAADLAFRQHPLKEDRQPLAATRGKECLSYPTARRLRKWLNTSWPPTELLAGPALRKFCRQRRNCRDPSAVAAEFAAAYSVLPEGRSQTLRRIFPPLLQQCANVEPPTPSAPPPKSEAPPKPAVEISPFVSENDVRRAMTRSEKIFIAQRQSLRPPRATWHGTRSVHRNRVRLDPLTRTQASLRF